MSLEAAKCPNCGAAIQVPNERESASCMYCGSTLNVKDAIDKLKIEVSGSVLFDANIETMLKSAEGFLELHRWDDARNIYNKIIELNSKDYRAWWGMVIVYTNNFTEFADRRHIEYYESAMKLVDLSVKGTLLNQYQEYHKKQTSYLQVANDNNRNVIYYDSTTSTFKLYPSPKNKYVALFLCVFIGYYGVHRFYVGKIDTGFIWMFSAGCFLIGWFMDIASIAKGTFTDAQGRPLV